MDGWCVNAGMDDWLPSEPVKPEERVPGGGVGGSRAAAASSQNQPKRNPSFLFYQNVLSACARSLSTSAFFSPRLARTFLLFFFLILCKSVQLPNFRGMRLQHECLSFCLETRVFC